MKPMLDPERDLKGATPETLAKALLRNWNLRPGAGRKDSNDKEGTVGRRTGKGDADGHSDQGSGRGSKS